MTNQLYYGDNLDVLRRYLPDESVDLIYLDPPFNSQANYNVLFEAPDGTKAASQIRAFDDTWTWDTAAAAALEEVITGGGEIANTVDGLRRILGPSGMLAYLAMMAPRLGELRRVLKPSGTIWLHCDPTASHYLKVLMDAVFGAGNFHNEVIWSYKRWTSSKKRLPRLHDVILVYSKTSEPYFLIPTVPNETPNPSQYVSAKDESGKTVVLRDDEGNPIKRETADEIQVGDVWEIPMLSPVAKERLGYPTQKPERLLQRVIEAACPSDGVVLDPFAGCGTTVVTAQKLKRRWIGIDITNLAVSLMKNRLAQIGADQYQVIGEPQSAEDAEQLAKDDPYQFQWWSLGLIGARPVEQKKGADKGIDGRLYFFDGGDPRQLIVSVKAGKVEHAHVRDLRGVLDREQAEIGVFISMKPPTKPMVREAASAGFYESPYGKHPKIQLVTVAELLEGKQLDLPPEAHQQMQSKAAARPAGASPGQTQLGFD